MDKKNVKKLIEFITKEPTEDEHKRGHKYPFMSAEILNAEISKIMDFFLIPDSELEMKDKILKNIDNELSFSDEFPETIKSKKTTETNKSDNEDKNNEEFVDVVEENDIEKVNKENDNNITNNNEKDNTNEIENKEENTDEKINEIKNEDTPLEKNNENAIINSEEPSDKIELLEYLLEFIETETELNYVLSGYFSKFFIALLNRNSPAVIILIFLPYYKIIIFEEFRYIY